MLMRIDAQALQNPSTFDNSEYLAGFGSAVRWEPYFYTDSQIDFHKEAVRRLGLVGTEAVLDVGSGQGAFLRNIHAQGHHGSLVGVDQSSVLFYEDKRRVFGFIQADASARPSTDLHSPDDLRREPDEFSFLPVKEDAFDVVTAMFMLYHTSDPVATIHDMVRIMHPEGTIVIATSGPNNKSQHRGFERLIADRMKIPVGNQPALYNRVFNTIIARRLLPQMFGQVVPWTHIEQMNISHDFQLNGVSGVEAYINSLKSMSYSYGETPIAQRRFNELVNAYARHIIDEEIEKSLDGFFHDNIHRELYICSEPNPDIFL